MEWSPSKQTSSHLNVIHWLIGTGNQITHRTTRAKAENSDAMTWVLSTKSARNLGASVMTQRWAKVTQVETRTQSYLTAKEKQRLVPDLAHRLVSWTRTIKLIGGSSKLFKMTETFLDFCDKHWETNGNWTKCQCICRCHPNGDSKTAPLDNQTFTSSVQRIDVKFRPATFKEIPIGNVEGWNTIIRHFMGATLKSLTEDPDKVGFAIQYSRDEASVFIMSKSETDRK